MFAIAKVSEKYGMHRKDLFVCKSTDVGNICRQFHDVLIEAAAYSCKLTRYAKRRDDA